MLESKRIDPRVSRTHALLIEAFRKVMMAKSFEAITIQDIASQATVNRATFYAHFPDKYALVTELIRVDFVYLLEERLHIEPQTTQAYLRVLFLAVTDHWARHTVQCQSNFNQFASGTEVQIKAHLRDHIHTWLQTHLTPHAQHRRDLLLVARLLSWSIYGAAVEWHVQPNPQPAEVFADTLIPLIMPIVTAL